MTDGALADVPDLPSDLLRSLVVEVELSAGEGATAAVHLAELGDEVPPGVRREVIRVLRGLSNGSATVRQEAAAPIQVAVAASLAIVAGEALSSQRYYWAVIAAFVAFTGTATATETVLKAVNRITGTLIGLVASVALAELTAGHVGAALGVVLVCLFLGFYLNKVSYAMMIFFITIVVGQPYSLLHEFQPGLLVLRLEETAIGGAIGVAVALLVLPISTQATALAAKRAFLDALATLLRHAAGQLANLDDQHDLVADTRDLDAALQQLLAVIRPLSRSLIFGSGARGVRRRAVLYMACDFFARGLVTHGLPAAPGGDRGVPVAAGETVAAGGNGRRDIGTDGPRPDGAATVPAEDLARACEEQYLGRLSMILRLLAELPAPQGT